MSWVSYQCCECLISIASVLSKNRHLEISTTSIYETSIVCALFSLNQHTSMLAAGIRLLAYKHRWSRVLVLTPSFFLGYPWYPSGESSQTVDFQGSKIVMNMVHSDPSLWVRIKKYQSSLGCTWCAKFGYHNTQFSKMILTDDFL